MRTSYPRPANHNNIGYYEYKLVDSSFIHAIHYFDPYNTVGSTRLIGVTFQDDQNTINWYNVRDALTIYQNLTNPKKSPGFVFNNSLRGKPFVPQKVVDKPLVTGVNPYTQKVVDKPVTEIDWKITFGPTKWELVETPKPVKTVKKPVNKPVEIESKSYGVLLEQCNKLSSCIKYLALGFNNATKGFVIYYAVDNSTTQQGATWQRNLRVIETDDASVYRDWVNAESLGKHFNKCIRHMDSKPLLAR
jgi:hypothetical protein